MPPQSSSPISQDEINSILWKACDTSRGTVDSFEYKNYIPMMLSLKVFRLQGRTIQLNNIKKLIDESFSFICS